MYRCFIAPFNGSVQHILKKMTTAAPLSSTKVSALKGKVK